MNADRPGIARTSSIRPPAFPPYAAPAMPPRSTGRPDFASRDGDGGPAFSDAIAPEPVVTTRPEPLRAPLPLTLFLFALMVPAVMTLQVGGITLSVYRVFLIACLPYVAVKYLSRQVTPAPICDTAVLFSWGWMAMSLLGRYQPDEVIEPIGVWGLETVVVYFLARVGATSRAQVGGLLKQLAIVVAIVGPIALAGSIMQVDPIREVLMPAIGFPNLYKSPGARLGLYREAMMFIHPIHWGMVAAAGFGAAVLLYRGIFTRGLVTAGVVAGAISSGSSGGLMTLVIQMGLYGWYVITPKFRGRWILLACLLAAAYVVVDLASNRSPLQVALSYLTLSPWTAHWRMMIWDFGMDNVWAHPVFGLGFEDWERPSWMYSGSMDNFWLAVMVRHGIPTVLLLGLPAAWGLFAGFRTLSRARKPDPVVMAYVMVLTAISLAAASVHFWVALLCMFMLIVGLGPCCLKPLPGDRN